MSKFGKSESWSSQTGVELSESSAADIRLSTYSNRSRTAQHHRLPAQDHENEGTISDALSVDTDSSYTDPSENDLNMLQAAALLTADCLGTGLLALPQDVKVLGRAVGLGFLILNLPINLFAGTILSNAAVQVELDQERDPRKDHPDSVVVIGDAAAGSPTDAVEQHMSGGDGLVRVVRKKNRSTYSSIDVSDRAELADTAIEPIASTAVSVQESASGHDHQHGADVGTTIADLRQDQHHRREADSSTYDFIGMTQEVFHHPRATYFVMAFFYTNIFLVLGDYILVMSHAVAAVIGEGTICLPTAGILASTLMFAFSQLRTMANLGRSATVISLLTLTIVVIQCLVAAQERQSQPIDEGTYVPPAENRTVLRMFSSIASIGFAVGSQKLFLNIRHEMKRREEAPKSLGTALTLYGTVYVGICLLSGPDPPAFLFDDIPQGLNRRIAGLLLWIHVAVSYAINSQAICASMDRMFFHHVTVFDLRHHPKRRWLLLTLLMAVSSYLVANVVPFFKDLVALIGALTSVPLTLLLPAVIHRRVIQAPLWSPTRATVSSYGLVLFGLIFLFTGLVGSLGSIELDWSNHGPPFSCDAEGND